MTKADKENQVSGNHADAQQSQTPSLEERPPLKVTAPAAALLAALSVFLHMNMPGRPLLCPVL